MQWLAVWPLTWGLRPPTLARPRSVACRAAAPRVQRGLEAALGESENTRARLVCVRVPLDRSETLPAGAAENIGRYTK